MRKYSLNLSTHIPTSTKIDVFELCIDNESIFEGFYDEIISEGNKSVISDLVKAIKIVEDTANLQRRPSTKFRQLNVTKIKEKVYEAKCGIIRIYLFHEENLGRVIITGGKKDNQTKDIKSITKTITDYTNGKK
ncbi:MULTISPECIES: hypothetical protein [Epilithonimonas]|uniref:Addiction module toxin RelE n=1 Tax=Epilithonimonas hominis TaxID=420404 RepID=A0A1H6M633_9FLAO|nr:MULTISPECIES: hypothetical protein [Epilithonimonas]SEH96799.1 hypothetical protein SAMN05421793_1718 [Epilithonimonas hominis]